jgi:hypothetical protein
MAPSDNGISEGMRAIIRDTAYEAAKNVAADLKKNVELLIQLHQAQCPVSKKLTAWENKGRGMIGLMMVVAAIIGGGVAAGARSLMSWFK